MSKAEAEKRAKALDWLNILLKETPGITRLDAERSCTARSTASVAAGPVAVRSHR